jgi:hypothetical protein
VFHPAQLRPEKPAVGDCVMPLMKPLASKLVATVTLPCMSTLREGQSMMRDVGGKE